MAARDERGLEPGNVTGWLRKPFTYTSNFQDLNDSIDSTPSRRLCSSSCWLIGNWHTWTGAQGDRCRAAWGLGKVCRLRAGKLRVQYDFNATRDCGQDQNMNSRSSGIPVSDQRLLPALMYRLTNEFSAYVYAPPASNHFIYQYGDPWKHLHIGPSLGTSR